MPQQRAPGGQPFGLGRPQMVGAEDIEGRAALVAAVGGDGTEGDGGRREHQMGGSVPELGQQSAGVAGVRSPV